MAVSGKISVPLDYVTMRLYVIKRHIARNPKDLQALTTLTRARSQLYDVMRSMGVTVTMLEINDDKPILDDKSSGNVL